MVYHARHVLSTTTLMNTARYGRNTMRFNEQTKTSGNVSNTSAKEIVDALIPKPTPKISYPEAAGKGDVDFVPFCDTEGKHHLLFLGFW